MRLSRPIVAAVFLIVLALPSRPASAATCESLASLALPNTTISAAQLVAAGAYVAPVQPGRGGAGPGRGNQFADLPAFCRVAASIKPSSDSDIKIELWMPASGWNGKFVLPGNGGFAGAIAPAGLATNLRNGYAAAVTDTGHEGGSGAFMLDHPEKLTDFAERAVHETAAKSKALIAAFYGNAPRRSYFNGCSTGGRQALTAAQRFPDDFDGIVAGAPAIYASRQSAGQLWIWNATHQDDASFLTPAKYAVLHDAVVAQCDLLDGVKDGVLEDPTRCRFDPKVVQCKDADGPGCLTAPQVEAARKIYTGAKNSKGELVFSPLFPGSELGWAASAGAQPVGYAIDVYRYLVMRDARWDPLTLNYDNDIARADKVLGQLTAIDPDLTKLLQHGKLLIYAGWSDPGIPPGYIVDYYKNVLAKTKVKNVRDTARLFMVPGMGHCGGGDGTSTFDMLGALDQWVEKGKAPEQIPASRLKDGVVDRTRPLCPYPQKATYSGSGSIDTAASFVCK
ncbi:MAG: tannase/feruloyl esterase family alpha/beta hydrolase [Acidobacteriota bacterium]